MLSFHQVVADDFTAVNQRIINQLHSDVPLVEDIGHHLIAAGGKRLRPLIVLLSARALGYSGHKHVDLAVIIEFIHTATLLHDDVVDTSDLRRGRPTATAQWGNAPSVLLGDINVKPVRSISTNKIDEGEVQQLVNAKDPEVTEDSYFSVIRKKPAILFDAACEAAALVSGATQTQQAALSAYGLAVGTAFQLVDDALDYHGDAETLGKNVGDDLAEGKPTLPLIYAMRKGSRAQSELIANAIRAGDASQLEAIVDIVEQSGAMDYTLDCARQQVETALAQLQQLPNNNYTQAMADLANFALERSH